MLQVMNGCGMLVLLRHGESQFNKEDRFSGWADCPLTRDGIRQAHEAGRRLREAGIVFDACFTSVLSRAVETSTIVLGELGRADIPLVRTWRLNERHYGIFEGVPKKDVVEKYGAAQVEAWRNSADAIPPPLPGYDMRHPLHQTLYRGVGAESLPSSECLREAFGRVINFFDGEIRPLVESGGRVLVVSHGNPIRAIVAHLNSCVADEIPIIAVGNAEPVVYAKPHNGSWIRL